MSELHIGLVGYGKMGRAHSQAWLTASRFFDHGTRPALAAICGRNRAATERVADQFGWGSVETDWRALVAREEIDLVDICTSNDLHSEVAVAAIRHGKHVVCEKPLALDAALARQMLAEARAAGIRHAVVFNYRFVPAVRLAKQLVDAGELGEVRIQPDLIGQLLVGHTPEHRRRRQPVRHRLTGTSTELFTDCLSQGSSIKP